MKDGVPETASSSAARDVYRQGAAPARADRVRLGDVRRAAGDELSAERLLTAARCTRGTATADTGSVSRSTILRSTTRANQVFRAGDVTTVEPGLYVDPEFIASLPDTPKNRTMRAKLAPAHAKYGGMGIRIEDDYLITSSGSEWMSRGAPREASEIEAAMKQRAPELPGGGTCRPKA
jgi:hypothetical protein